MTTEMKPHPRIPALYFNKKGHGPDLINLELVTVDRLPGGKIACGLMIAESDTAPYLVAPIGDGLYLEQDQVAALYEACGEWLSKNARQSLDSKVTDRGLLRDADRDSTSSDPSPAADTSKEQG